MNDKQSRKKKILFALISTILFFALVEIEMRIMEFVKPRWFQINVADQETIVLPTHQKLLFGLQPGQHLQTGRTYQINSHAWRGPEISKEKKPGVYRIMFLGDSSVWGEGVAKVDAFPWLSASLIQQALGRPIEAINTATPGYSSAQSRIVFEDNVDWVKPDAVVIANIWSDIIVRPWTDEEMLRRFSTEGYRFESGVRSVLRHTATFRLLESRIVSSKGIPENRRLAISSIINANVKPSSTGTPRVPVLQHLENLRGIAKECKKRGILVVPLILPIDTKAFPWPEDRLKAYQNNFRKVASEYDGILVDAFSIFKSDPEALTYLFIDGLHPNSKGHEIIAKALAGAMIDRLQPDDGKH